MFRKRITLVLVAELVLLVAFLAAAAYYWPDRQKPAEEAAPEAVAEEEAEEPEPEKPALTEEEINDIDILMVDDMEQNVRVVDRFEKLGCDVTTVARFEEADPDDYDALIIPGGNNVTPSTYGAERSEFTSDTDLSKDETQLAAIKAFAREGKPIFGICRGCQLLNVAFGGTLDQGNGVYHKEWHEVLIDENSRFYPVFGDSVNAYHYHKQQVGRVADGFVATQRAADNENIIEAIEHESKPFIGLQWHCDARKMNETGEAACQVFIDMIKDYKRQQAS